MNGIRATGGNRTTRRIHRTREVAKNNDTRTTVTTGLIHAGVAGTTTITAIRCTVSSALNVTTGGVRNRGTTDRIGFASTTATRTNTTTTGTSLTTTTTTTGCATVGTTVITLTGSSTTITGARFTTTSTTTATAG
jgi:hypothetical protein